MLANNILIIIHIIFISCQAMLTSINLPSFSKTSRKLALGLIVVGLWSLFSCQQSPKHQKEAKKVLCLILQEGQSDGDTKVKKVVFEREIRKLWAQAIIRILPSSQQLLDVLFNDSDMYNWLIIHWHWIPGGINADPEDAKRKIDRGSFSYVSNTIDITQAFLEKNQLTFSKFANNNLSPDANILLISCETWSNTVEVDKRPYDILPIAESLAHSLPGHYVFAPIYNIAIASEVGDQAIYAKNFLSKCWGTFMFDFSKFNLYHKSEGVVSLEPLEFFTIGNDIKTNVYKEFSMGEVPGVRPAAAKDFPRFYFKN